MKITLVFILLFFSNAVISQEKIKQVTVSDFLQQAKSRAIAEGRKANNLVNESSPYLLQHAYNPVNWYTWGEAAFAKAKKENKPIFLSIGYSTCHWCHVMAHESFENKDIAELLNKNFVAIKVDREQRPDIDSIYMLAAQLISGHGGWPMTVFLDHELRPFHAATYYPPFSTATNTGLNEVLLKINDLWLNQPQLIKQVATTVTARITAHADAAAKKGVLKKDIYEIALKQITESFDEEFGGFSVAPKFPRPGIFALLNKLALSDSKSTSENSSAAKEMMRVTLDAMAAGGIYDHVAGGFHRYSVDERWQVPHFEKMLYSQALMIMAYSDYYRVDPQSRYKEIVYQTLDFVKQEMQSPAGGFYSALDADSKAADSPAGIDHGKPAEGAYYLWHNEELSKILNQTEYEFIKKYFQVGVHGNIESDPQNEFTGLNVFYIDETFRNESLTRQQNSRLISAIKKLNSKRRLRPRPQLDDKIITAWNAMMLTACVKASQVFNDGSLLDESIATLKYIKQRLYNNGKLYRQYRAGKASTEATLADYAWLVYGSLQVYEAAKDAQWLRWAVELHDKQNELFLDKASGAYFESVAGDDSLLFRSRNMFDGALPSANAIALSNLRALSRLQANSVLKKSYTAQANKLVSSFANTINQSPASASMLLAVELR